VEDGGVTNGEGRDQTASEVVAISMLNHIQDPLRTCRPSLCILRPPHRRPPHRRKRLRTRPCLISSASGRPGKSWCANGLEQNRSAEIPGC
jgi:hypothetical protein